MAVGVLAFVLLAIALGAGLLLFLAVRAESNRRESMTRQDAERTARRDAGRGTNPDSQRDRSDRR